MRHEVLNVQGEHLRRIHGELAEHLVKVGTAKPEPSNGRIRAVRLARIAAHNAAVLGPPTALTARSYGTRFTRRVKSESGHSWIEHHPRSFE